MVAGVSGSLPIMSSVGKQEEMNTDAQLTFSVFQNGTLANEIALSTIRGGISTPIYSV